jgi:hypothetical protein
LRGIMGRIGHRGWLRFTKAQPCPKNEPRIVSLNAARNFINSGSGNDSRIVTA